MDEREAGAAGGWRPLTGFVRTAFRSADDELTECRHDTDSGGADSLAVILPALISRPSIASSESPSQKLTPAGH